MIIDLKKKDDGHYEADLPNTAGICIGVVVRSLGMPVDDSQIQQMCPVGANGTEVTTVIKVLKQLTMKAKLLHPTVVALNTLPIPSIARLKSGNYVAIGRCDGKNIVVVDPLVGYQAFVPLEEFTKDWNGEVIQVTQSLALKWRQFKRRFNVQWFTTIIMQYKRLLGETVAAAFFLQLFGLVMPLFTQVIIDKVIPNNGLATLDILAGTLFVFGLFQTMMSILRTYIFTHTTTKIDVILGTRLFRHIASLPLQYFETRRVGDTLMRVAAMTGIRDFLTGSTVTALMDTFFSIVFIAVMFYYSVPLTLLVLVVLPIYLIQNIIATPIYRRKLEAVWAASAASNAFLVEAITGIHTIKSLAIEPQFVHRWEELLAKSVRTSFDNSVVSMVLGNTGNLVRMISGFSIFWLGGHMVMESQMTIGQLIAFQMLASQASGSFLNLLGMWQSVQQIGLSIERVGDIINSPPELGMAQNHGIRPNLQGHIRMEKMNFRYRRETGLVLQSVDITIAAGTRVGIVGRSGSGKSTLTKLIQRLYLPESGKVMIDEIDISQVDPTWLRRQIGVVLQENYLFNGSVRDNIATVLPSSSMAEVIRVAKIAGAHDFILELREGYDTKVGERGMSLSGGQRQRIAIARALLTNPRIIIFDEATSALDYESERIIMDNLDEICAGRTMIMIAHRLSTVRHCDNIIVLDHGQVLEQGTHDVLMELKGLYHKLYLQQEG